MSFSYVKQLCCYGILLFIITLTATNAFGQRMTSGSKVLEWKSDMVSKYGENEAVKLLNFEGARYDGTLNSLPYYTERIPHPFPGTDVSVQIKNAYYEPFTTSANIDLSKIGYEPELKAHAVTEKKQSQLGITLLPVRKNSSD